MTLIISNIYLERSQMTDNAQYIADYLIGNGWTQNAVAGILGNMEQESTIQDCGRTSNMRTCLEGTVWCSGRRQRNIPPGLTGTATPGVETPAVRPFT